jgi:hypothetical protein
MVAFNRNPWPQSPESAAHHPGGLKPAMTRDNMAFGISENWIGKAERFD